MLKEDKHLKLDFVKQTDDEIVDRYLKLYPEKNRENMLEYVQCQRLIHDHKNKQSKRRK